ncbi:S9 family peptidase [Ferroacidibacillus organovorans]|nr:S9 family peptidase [Ferroacidibacillus organovorans]
MSLQDNKKTPFHEEDFYRFTWLSHPRFSPDGSLLGVGLRRVNAARDGYREIVGVLDVVSRKLTEYTSGEFSDTFCDLSPSHLLFCSADRAALGNQLYVMPLHGGEAKRLTSLAGDVKTGRFSPAGTRIAALVACVDGEPLTREKDDEDKKKKALAPYVVEKLPYKRDGKGLVDQKKTQVFILDAQSGDVLAQTHLPHGVTSYSFTQDEAELLLVTPVTDEPYRHETRVVLWNRETGEERAVSTGTESIEQATVAPDGAHWVGIGSDFAFYGATQPLLYRGALTGEPGSPERYIEENFDYGIHAAGMSDMRGHEELPGPLFMADGQSVLAPVSHEGRVSLAVFSPSGKLTWRVNEPCEVYAYAYNKATDTVAYLATDVTQPGELFFSTGDGIEQITDVNPWLRERIIAPVVDTYHAADDGVRLHTFFMDATETAARVENQNRPEKTPLVLQIHGGPHAMYSYSFVFEFQLIAAKGYAVVYGNPRGSFGYGQAFVKRCMGDYGGRDFADLMNILDATLAAQKDLDRDALGVTGGSYGGFMTNWIVGHTSRFRAAVTQRSISNWVSFYGVSDIGYEFTEREHHWHLRDTPFTNIDDLWKVSPLRYVASVETPLLILHGENDLRCPIEQGEQMYTALAALGKEVAFVRFPGANHDLSRTGHPGLRVARYQHMVGWFQTHLS